MSRQLFCDVQSSQFYELKHYYHDAACSNKETIDLGRSGILMIFFTSELGTKREYAAQLSDTEGQCAWEQFSFMASRICFSAYFFQRCFFFTFQLLRKNDFCVTVVVFNHRHQPKYLQHQLVRVSVVPVHPSGYFHHILSEIIRDEIQ